MELLFMPVLVCAIFLAFLIVLSVLTPSWRWVVPVIVMAWIAIAYCWYDHAVVSSRPGYNGSIGAALGEIYFTAVTIGVLLGTVIYAGFTQWLCERQQAASPSSGLAAAPPQVKALQ
jgi:hypothetical protein